MILWTKGHYISLPFLYKCRLYDFKGFKTLRHPSMDKSNSERIIIEW